MSRFTLSQLFMGIALIAIVLTFTQAEGCGRRYSMIESISFAPDGSRIAVTTLNARDACTPFKAFKADISRTVSWLDAATGESCGAIDQDFKPGNRFTAFEYWRIGRTSALCNPSNDHVTMSAFGGGDITLNADAATPRVVSLESPVWNIAYSKSGRFLAASGLYGLTVLDTQRDSVVMRVWSHDLPFQGATLMSFTNDDARITLGGPSSVQIWDIATAAQYSTVVPSHELSPGEGEGIEPHINDIAVAPNENLVVCSDDWVRRYDFDGNIVATLANKGAYLCSIASDGNCLAICDIGELTIYDLNANDRLHSLPFQHATALALSSRGDELAVGDFEGRVTLIDTATGARRWSSNPPGRYRWPWTLPASFLATWILVVSRVSQRKKIADKAQLEIRPGV